MASQQCDGCGEEVSIAGGIADIWSSQQRTTGGIELELADGAEVFCCFSCIEALPDDHDVTVADVEALERDPEDG